MHKTLKRIALVGLLLSSACLITSFGLQQPVTEGLIAAYLEGVPLVKSKIPRKLPRLEKGPVALTWEEAANLGVASFGRPTARYYEQNGRVVSAPDQYIGRIQWDRFLPHQVFYILGSARLGEVWELPEEEQTAYFVQAEALKRQFFSMPRKAQNAFYKWVRPSYKEAYIALPSKYQQIYYSWARDAHAYVQIANFEEEAEYFERIRANETAPSYYYATADELAEARKRWPLLGDWQSRFYHYRPNGTMRPNRRMETFLVRAYLRGMAAEDITYWVNTLMEDMTAWHQEAKP